MLQIRISKINIRDVVMYRIKYATYCATQIARDEYVIHDLTKGPYLMNMYVGTKKFSLKHDKHRLGKIIQESFRSK